jgi:hypothetical protein
MAEDGDSAAAPADPFGAGVTSLRDTAKWIITIFASVGAVLTAGSQLSNIGRLPVPPDIASNRVPIAIVSGILVLIGIGTIIWQGVKVLTTGGGNFNQLSQDEAAYLVNSGALGAQYSSIGEIQAAVTAIDTERSGLDWADLAQRERIRALENQLGYINRLVTRAAAALRYQKVVKAFHDAAKWMLAGGALTAIAFVVFVWATNPPAPSEAPEFVVPANATLSLTPEQQQQLAKSLGETCVQGDIPVVILSTDDERADVVSVAQGDCKLARFEIDTTSLQRKSD